MTPTATAKATLTGLVLLLTLASASAQPLQVARVIDGDTFELSDGRRVRLIGIDTPEVHPSSKLRSDAQRSGTDTRTIQELGRRASSHARQLALDKRVELEYDQANSATAHRDRYGRTLAYVHVLGSGGTRIYMVNARMVADGYAYAYTQYPFAYSDEFLRLQRTARSEGRGLWADNPAAETGAHVGPALSEPAADAAATSVVYVTRTGRKYHRAGCRYLARSSIPIRLLEAAASYGACSVCRPP